MMDHIPMRASIIGDYRQSRLRPVALRDHEEPTTTSAALTCRRCQNRMFREEFTRTRPGQPGELVVRWRCVGSVKVACSWFEDEGEAKEVLAERMARHDEKGAARQVAAARGIETQRLNRERRKFAEAARMAAAEETLTALTGSPADEQPAEPIAPTDLPARAQAWTYPVDGGTRRVPFTTMAEVRETIASLAAYGMSAEGIADHLEADVADIAPLMPPPPATRPSSADPAPDVPHDPITEEAPTMPRSRKTAAAPASYTPEQIERLCRLVLDEGLSPKEAARKARIHAASVYFYLNKERRRRAEAAQVTAECVEAVEKSLASPPAGLALEGPAHEGIDPAEREAPPVPDAGEVDEDDEDYPEPPTEAAPFRERALALDEAGEAKPAPVVDLLFTGEIEEVRRCGPAEEMRCPVTYEEVRDEGEDGPEDLSFPERLARASGDLHVLARSMEQRAAAFRAAIAAMVGIA